MFQFIHRLPLNPTATTSSLSISLPFSSSNHPFLPQPQSLRVQTHHNYSSLRRPRFAAGVCCRFFLTQLIGRACDDCWRLKCLSGGVRMYAVGRIGSYISRGVDTVSAPFHPFGGAVDMIVVRQADGSLKSSPWYVRFGKFQGVLKTREKVVNITVNGVDANFHMCLDHKGEAYFLSEVNVEEEKAGLYRSSSGEDTDKQVSKRLTKSDSFETEVKQPNSARQADGRDDCKREQDAWSASRRARILGLVFGSRSFKERMAQQSPEDEEMKRARLLERAEIAADLLDLKWSTTLATKKPKRNKSQDSSPDPMTTDSINDVVIDKERNQVSSIVFDKVKHERDKGNHVNGAVRMELSDSSICMATNVGNIEPNYESKSPMKYSLFVAQDSSDSLEIPGTKENLKDLEDNLCNRVRDLERSNLILDSSSVIGIRLVTDDSVDTENSEVIHPTDVVISRTHEDKSAEIEEAGVSGTFSHQSSLCSSCISEDEVSGPDESETVDQSFYRTKVADSQNICNKTESSHDDADHQLGIHSSMNPVQSTSFQASYASSDEEQFCFSNLDNSKVSKSSATCGDTDSPKEADECNVDESFSSSNNVDHPKMPNIVEEHFKFQNDPCQQANENDGHFSGSLPDKLSDINAAQALHLQDQCQSLDSPLTQKSDDLSISGKNASTEVGSLEPVDVADKSWGIWPFTFKRSRSMKSSKPVTRSPRKALSCSYAGVNGKQDTDDVKPKPIVTRKKMKSVIPTAEQLASLNLKDGRNEVTFTFSTAMLGDQRVDARIFVWKWNSRIVISDVDGTITRSDVLGQVMPLVGMDWSHIGVTQLFSAIKENGYQLLFLSARSISQAYHTRQFLFNLKQNGLPLPDGPVVISPDGLFPSLFREVIRRAPHEFKIACLEDIKSCFPSDCNPFYAGFGNRDTDEFSYLKVGIPKGKIFIINPKGEVAVHRRLDTKSYTSLHALVNGIFPPTSSTEQEDFNSWNFWKLPPPTL